MVDQEVGLAKSKALCLHLTDFLQIEEPGAKRLINLLGRTNIGHVQIKHYFMNKVQLKSCATQRSSGVISALPNNKNGVLPLFNWN